MTRLLRGESRMTNGQLSVSNLGREAGLTRQQVHRCGILPAWEEALAIRDDAGEGPVDANRAEIDRLRGLLKDAQRKAKTQREQLDQANAESETLACVLRVQDEELDRLRSKVNEANHVTSLQDRR